MLESDIHAFLEEEVITKRNIVTFRLLSRELKIHVNEAKNALASFYAKEREKQQPIHATFWLSGEKEQGGEADDDVTSWCATIVDEDGLDNARAKLKTITSLHVYALTPLPLKNASELCASANIIRDIDDAGGAELAAIVGKITSQNITTLPSTKSGQKASNQKVPGPSKLATSNPPPKVKEEQATNGAGELAKAKPKQTGKLDWSQGKRKDSKKELTEPAQMKKSVAAKVEPASSPKDTGKKRKGSPHDEEPEAPKATPIKQEAPDKARVKKGVVLSDEEDDEKPVIKPSQRKRQSKIVNDDIDMEPSLRAMMDVDDSQVIKASSSRPTAVAAPPSEADSADEEPPAQDDSMAIDNESDDPAPKAKPRKRKEKKVVPVGRNGLKKKRVLKTKVIEDAKGYEVTMEYSSYESVDEEEEDQKATAKPKAKPKKTLERKPSAKIAPSESESELKPKPSPAAASAKKAAPTKSAPLKGRASGGSQKNLNSFFGAKAKS